MGIKLLVATEDAESQVLSENKLEKDAVAIGRTKANDVVLESAKVSHRHARLERRDGSWWLIDLKSTNGTFAGGQRLEPGKPKAIASGDRFMIDGFLLTFLEEEEAEQTLVSRESTRAGPPPPPKAADLAEALCAAYALRSSAPFEERRVALQATLRSALETADPEARRAICRELLARFEPEPAAARDTPAAAPSGDFRKQEALYRAGLQALSGLAERFVGDDSFASAEEVARFATLFHQALEITLGWIETSLKARREFEGQMGVELSRIFTRERDPIKAAGSAAEIGKYLLDFHAERRLEAGKVALDEAFNDLTLHQLGLLRGLQECIKTLLRKLDPAELEREVIAHRRGWWSALALKLPRTLALGAWRQYKQSYETALDENNAFMGLFPVLKEGYVKYHEEALGRGAPDATSS